MPFKNILVSNFRIFFNNIKDSKNMWGDSGVLEVLNGEMQK